MKIRHLFIVAPALLVLAQLSCSSSGSTDGSADTSDCTKNPITPVCKAIDYSALASAPVSFKADIFEPILRPTCNSSACHGTPLDRKNADFPPGGLYLGPLAADTVTTVDDKLLATINTELLEPSQTAPSMKLVVPNDPASSFLMLKLTGCQNTKGLACTVQSVTFSETKQGCGDTMPPSCYAKSANLTLTETQIATVARWIAQGAKNN